MQAATALLFSDHVSVSVHSQTRAYALSVRLRRRFALLIIIEGKAVHPDGAALLNAKLLKLFQNPLFPQKVLKEFKAFLRFQIRIRKHFFDARALHNIFVFGLIVDDRKRLVFDIKMKLREKLLGKGEGLIIQLFQTVVNGVEKLPYAFTADCEMAWTGIPCGSNSARIFATGSLSFS